MASKQQSLGDAKAAKQDEFYTQLSDIEKELRHYKKHFKDKVVYLNCDDPRESEFFHYFSYKLQEARPEEVDRGVLQEPGRRPVLPGRQACSGRRYNLPAGYAPRSAAYSWVAHDQRRGQRESRAADAWS